MRHSVSHLLNSFLRLLPANAGVHALKDFSVIRIKFVLSYVFVFVTFSRLTYLTGGVKEVFSHGVSFIRTL